MRTLCGRRARLAVALAALLIGCGSVPVKQYYVLNYVPVQLSGRLQPTPYPFTVRLKEFDIEDAYGRSQIVYRQSPFELRYYFYKLWAVKPTRMITDLVYQHLTGVNLVSHVIRRYDEGIKPDFELSGLVSSIEEYDSDKLWFAHLSLRLTLTRLSDGRVVYSHLFDNRKRVYQYSPDNVVRELSGILEFIMNQAIHDLDQVLSKENGPSESSSAGVDSSRIREIEKFKGEGGE
jgi:ABC-type uncharacterized transport system auxiliary subunit